MYVFLLLHPSDLLHAQVTEEDYNFDGKPDQIRFRATVQSLQQVYSAKLLLQFSYQLQVGMPQVPATAGAHYRRTLMHSTY